jgi:hypothetical protein
VQIAAIAVTIAMVFSMLVSGGIQKAEADTGGDTPVPCKTAATSLDGYVTNIASTITGASSGDSGTFVLQYKIPAGAVNTQSCAFTYAVPDGLSALADSGTVSDDTSGSAIGTYTIADGLITISFYESFAQKGGTVNGKVTADFTVNANDTGQTKVIKFPGSGTTIEVKPKPAPVDQSGLTLAKDGGAPTGDWHWNEDNSVTVPYTVTVSAKQGGTKSTVDITDTLGTLPKGVKAATYDNASFVVTKVAADHSTTEVTQYTKEINNQATPPTYTLSNLPQLATGESYKVNYSLNVVADPSVSGNTEKSDRFNTATAKSGSDTDTKTAPLSSLDRSLGKKAGVLNADGTITWTITLNESHRLDLSKYSFSGDMLRKYINADSPTSQNITGTFTFTNKTKNQTLDTKYTIPVADGGLALHDIVGDAKYDTWVITYTQKDVDTPTAGGSLSYDNTAIFTNGSTNIDITSGKVGKGTGGRDTFKLEKSATGESHKESDATDSQIAWTSGITLPLKGIAEGTTLTDALENCTYEGESLDCQVFNADSKAPKLVLTDKSNSSTELSEGTDYSIDYLKDAKPVDTRTAGWTADSFEIKFLKDIANADGSAKITMTYESHADYSKVPAGKTVSLKNTLTSSIKSNPAVGTHTHYKTGTAPQISKTALHTNVDYSSDKNNQRLWFTIGFNTNGQDVTKGTHTITDSLPENTSYVQGSMTAVYKGTNVSVPFVTVAVAEDGKTLVFTIDGDYGAKEIDITYSLSYSDDSEYWENASKCEAAKRTYTNKASIDGIEPGTTAEVTVNRNPDKALVKSGVQDSQNGTKVDYAVVVNPQAEKLNKSDDKYITLVDKLTTPSSVSTSSLIESSVVLYAYDASAEGNKGAVIPSSEYSVAYDRTNDTLTVSHLKDSTAYVLNYSYFIAPEAFVSGKTFSISNEAEIEGTEFNSGSVPTNYTASKAGASRQILKYHKVDDLGKNVSAGARFLLEKYDGSTWAADPTVNPMDTNSGKMVNDGGYITTNEDSVLQFDLSGDANFVKGALYRLTETNAPAGYLLNNTPQYFSIDSLPTVLPHGVEAKDINLVKSSDGNEFGQIVDKQSTSLSVSKVWDDADDQDGVRPSSVSVKLMAGVEGKDPQQVDSATLSSDSGWKHEFTDLPVYKDGVKLVYSVVEEQTEALKKDYPDPQYASVEGGFKVTNKHIPSNTPTPSAPDTPAANTPAKSLSKTGAAVATVVVAAVFCFAVGAGIMMVSRARRRGEPEDSGAHKA